MKNIQKLKNKIGSIIANFSIETNNIDLQLVNKYNKALKKATKQIIKEIQNEVKN